METPNIDQGSIAYMLGRLDGKVDALLTKAERSESRIDDLDRRLSAVEETKAKGIGAWRVILAMSSVISLILGAYADKLWDILFK